MTTLTPDRVEPPGDALEAASTLAVLTAGRVSGLTQLANQAGCGAVLHVPGDVDPLRWGRLRLGELHRHLADWRSVLLGLSVASAWAPPASTDLVIQTDSALVLNQWKGTWPTRKAEHAGMLEEFGEWEAEFASVSIVRIPRLANHSAEWLAYAAIEGRMTGAPPPLAGAVTTSHIAAPHRQEADEVRTRPDNVERTLALAKSLRLTSRDIDEVADSLINIAADDLAKIWGYVPTPAHLAKMVHASQVTRPSAKRVKRERAHTRARAGS